MTLARYAIGALLAISLLGGCSSRAAGRLSLQSFGDEPAVLAGRYVVAVYDYDRAGRTTFYLSEVPLDELTDGRPADAQVVHIELLWQPRPGRTPMDDSATNVTIRQVLFAGDEVGVYGGAGFGRPLDRLGSKRLALAIDDASMRLVERTERFADRLGLATMSGTVTARRDAAKVQRIAHALNQHVTNAIGRTRIVHDDEVDAVRVAALP
ncbi:MAG: hypothetical protein KDA25_11955 [Phycisphaerales bacterium]|nr:hypothetical protein [Phycisphaerales bacterium]